jgi:predicted phage baseplate assembly protein
MSGATAPHRSARRAELLEQLIVAMATSRSGALGLRDRALTDPTVALLDAWATVGDVLGFYLDRIAEEGYLSTATQPGSLLALASLVGCRPQPGLAAQVHAAYALNVDPDDKAVLLAPGLLIQTVAGPGEQPQTFETTESLLARPSWNLLAPKRARPLALPGDAADLPGLVITGTTANLSANDVILLEVSGTPGPVLVHVAGAQADLTAGVTRVAFVRRDGAPAHGSSHAAPPPDAITDAIDTLVAGGLAKPVPAVSGSVDSLPRTHGTVFAPDSDTLPRMTAALKPAVASTLYSALDTTVMGVRSVTGASVMRATAAPFGAQVAPKPLFDDRGQPAGSEDWPIGDSHTLTLSMSEASVASALRQALGAAQQRGIDLGARLRHLSEMLRPVEARAEPADVVLDVSCAIAGLSGDDLIELTDRPPWPPGDLSPLGRLEVSVADHVATVQYTGSDDARVQQIVVTATLDPATDGIALDFDGGAGRYVWDPRLRAPIRVEVGGRRLTISWSGQEHERTLSASVETPLALTDRAVLSLDGRYPMILPDTPVVIERAAGAAPSDVAYPVLAIVQGIDTVSVSRYGQTAKVTRLILDRDWIGTDDVLQTALRGLTVRAAPSALALAPVPVTDDISGDTLELNALVAGMEPGRVIAVRGTRTDLPGGATAPGGELAMVARITDGADAGDTTHTTLHLAGALAYSYQRESVQIYGNVVSAHQGATITEILGSGQAGQAHQTFTLSTSPLLADPAPGPTGLKSTLTVTVDGVGYEEVARLHPGNPPRAFLTANDALGHTTITFAAPLPAGSGNVLASYRAGDGSRGDVRADQLSQLLTRPAGVAGVSNPLPASGGTAGDGPEAVRAAAPTQLRGLGRIVTVSDYADLASSWAGVAKASAQTVVAGARDTVLVTVAGTDPAPLDPQGAVRTGVAVAVARAADPDVPVLVVGAGLFMIVLGATVAHDPLAGWNQVAAATRAALQAAFGYERRRLDQDVALGDLIAAAHSVPAVRSFTVTALALVPAQAAAADLPRRLQTLLSRPVAPVTRLTEAEADWGVADVGRPRPAAVAYVDAALPETVMLHEQPS